MIERIKELHPEEDFSYRIEQYDDAIIGVAEDFNSPIRLIYSVKKYIDILISESMTEEDALEHFSYNVEGAYLGPKTPIWCQDRFE